MELVAVALLSAAVAAWQHWLGIHPPVAHDPALLGAAQHWLLCLLAFIPGMALAKALLPGHRPGQQGVPPVLLRAALLALSSAGCSD